MAARLGDRLPQAAQYRAAPSLEGYPWMKVGAKLTLTRSGGRSGEATLQLPRAVRVELGDPESPSKDSADDASRRGAQILEYLNEQFASTPEVSSSVEVTRYDPEKYPEKHVEHVEVTLEIPHESLRTLWRQASPKQAGKEPDELAMAHFQSQLQLATKRFIRETTPRPIVNEFRPLRANRDSSE